MFGVCVLQLGQAVGVVWIAHLPAFGHFRNTARVTSDVKSNAAILANASAIMFVPRKIKE